MMLRAEVETLHAELQQLLDDLRAFHDQVANALGEDSAATLRLIIGTPADDCVICGDRRYSARAGRCAAHRLHLVR
jgi:hypothetical protein